jgi:hypothetical protein
MEYRGGSVEEGVSGMECGGGSVGDGVSKKELRIVGREVEKEGVELLCFAPLSLNLKSRQRPQHRPLTKKRSSEIILL